MSERVPSGKTAFVFGASSGIGRATAGAFGRAGLRVGLAARRRDELDLVAHELSGLGAEAVVATADVRDQAEVVDAVELMARQLGPPDVVVYAAGTNLKERSLEQLSAAGWRELIETNLSGAFNVTQAVLPALRSTRGLIVYISSASAKMPDVSGVAYQASKLGLVGLAHGTMVEEARNGVRTTVIFPGLTDTPLLLKRPVPTPPEVVARGLQPQDVAAACLFVAQLPARAHVPELMIYPSSLKA
jgi:NADP-dependent 3-hydroxy acid dehydrogenase YdfG